jgi:sporulation protein YlmC with PRC-barrel domain
MRYIPYEDRHKAYRSPETGGASIDRAASQAKSVKPPLILGMFATAALAGAIALLGYGLHGLGPVQRDVAQIVAATTPQAGMTVLSADGETIGTVESIDAEQDGRVTALNVTSSGFLGFGIRLVAIPEGKFSAVGDKVRVELTLDDIQRLPHQGP